MTPEPDRPRCSAEGATGDDRAGAEGFRASGWFDRFCGEAPAERLAVVRAAVFGFGAIYLFVRTPAIRSVHDLSTDRFEPIGPLSLLSGPIPDVALSLTLLTSIVACGLAAVGLRYRASAAVGSLGLLFVLTYRLSWGQVLHTENLLVVHGLLLAVMPAADAWSWDGRSSQRRSSQRRSSGERSSWSYGWALQTLALATALGYVVAAWAKVRNGGLDWVTGDVLRNHIAFDNLRKEVLGDPSSPFASLTVPRGWLFPPMAAASMVIEFGAIAALWRGPLRRVWVAATWMFHVAILGLMAILFPYQLLGIAFLPFVRGEVFVRRSWRAFHRRREALRR